MIRDVIYDVLWRVILAKKEEFVNFLTLPDEIRSTLWSTIKM